MHARSAVLVAPSPPPRARRRAIAQGRSAFAEPVAPLVAAAAVAVLVVVSLTAFRSSGLVASLWGAGGVAVAVWLRSPDDRLYDLTYGGMIAVAIMAGQLLAGNPPGLGLMLTAANMIEIGLAVFLMRRFVRVFSLSGVEPVARLLAVAAVAPLAGGLAGVAALALVTGEAGVEAGVERLLTWWFGHALSLAIITPFGLALSPRHLAVLRRPWRWAEAVALFAALVALCFVTMVASGAPIGFAFVPLLILIAARLRVIGVTAALLVMAVCSASAVMAGTGPYQAFSMSLADRAVLAQLTLLFGYLPVLLVACLLDERDRLFERARAGQARAERASAAKSRLLANVAHEIKSPVSGVIGIGELWSAGQLGAVTQAQREMADMLVKTARQVEALSHDLLDVAQAEAGAVRVDLRPTDVVGLLEDVRRQTELRPDAAALKLTLASEAPALLALADSQRLIQVLSNLAVNAVKYGAAGGVVRFRAFQDVDVIRLEVADDGPGLTAEKQAQLFEPFNRLGLERSSVEGHGIGLALSKRLVELMRGQIGVESAPGEGALFWIELPAA